MADIIDHQISGRVVLFDESNTGITKTKLVDILESCAHRSKQRVLETDWVSLRNSGNYIELTLTEPQVIKAESGAELDVNGIIFSTKVALTSKSLILARHGTTYYSPFFGCNTAIYDIP